MDRYLVLENGQVFKGKGFGADGEVIAEVIFTTGMNGYLETLTDKNYFGQIVLHTFPLIGNYGVIPSDIQGKDMLLSGYIAKDWCDTPSNFRSEGDIDSLLKQKGIVGLCGIDTRAVTRLIRDNGVMNGAITSNPDNIDIAALKDYRITGGVETASVKTFTHIDADSPRFNLAVLDMGGIDKIKNILLAKGCSLDIFPYNTTAAEIFEKNPDGVVVTGGPGDPNQLGSVIDQIEELIKSYVPMLGVGLGHQLIGLAHGFSTYKLKYGHHGANQPVRESVSGRIYITSQNHGYALDDNSMIGDTAFPLFSNLNDHSCEGLVYSNYRIITTQFVPEAGSVQMDTTFIYDRLLSMMEEDKECR